MLSKRTFVYRVSCSLAYVLAIVHADCRNFRKEKQTK